MKITKKIVFAVLIFSAFIQSAECSEFHAIVRERVTISYQEGIDTAALGVLNMIPSIRERIEQRTGLAADFPFKVLMYRTRVDFVKRSGNPMIAAYAVPDENMIVLDLSQMRTHPFNIELITMHELTHLILHHHIRREHLPKWFNEGVSEWVSGISEIINPGKTDVLKKAAIGNRLIPFYRLEHSFPQDKDRFSLAYEQSRSMIEYIESEYGEDTLRSVIVRLKRRESLKEAVRKELSITFAELESFWLKDMDIRYTWIGYISNNIYWILFVFAGIVVVIGFIRLKWRIKNYTDDEEEDEIAYLEKMFRSDGQDKHN